MIVVLDQQSATISAFDLEGEFLYQSGRVGRGPGEFTNPYWIGFDGQGRLVVLEGAANHRIQLLSADDGRHIDVLTENILVPRGSKAYVEDVSSSPRLVFYTIASCPGDQRSFCAIQEHDLSSERMVQRFAPIEEVDPRTTMLKPYKFGRTVQGETYIGNANGERVAVYDRNGSYVRSFSVAGAPDFVPLETSSLPEGQEEIFQEITSRKYSRITSITPVGDDVVIGHYYDNNQRPLPRFISVFSKAGTHRASFPWEHLVAAVQGDRFFFVEADRSSDLGSYVVHEYRYKGF